ncbi:MAG: hypothetical protein IPH94_02750 [Saprospiraceae bacterium]|nr:hypothetical protein [Saprospiraceae bacterium]MBK7220281.1 hypothetical protein [Saprospiraceae bacterium]MBK7787480.1 hypothetical protein [Saprospiraceae bacterium]MBK8109708.1 hypothetical protein [Saprospiraceae bacterium]MBK8849218.1 hypothetical protein [Saprospiraceae bacterium]
MILEITLFFALVVLITLVKSGNKYEAQGNTEEKPKPAYKKFRPGISNLMM